MMLSPFHPSPETHTSGHDLRHTHETSPQTHTSDPVTATATLTFTHTLRVSERESERESERQKEKETERECERERGGREREEWWEGRERERREIE